MNEKQFFPRYIDNPRLIGVFEMDEFVIFFGGIVTTMVASLAFPSFGSLSAIFSGVALGGGGSYFYKKFKKNKPNGYATHFLYKKSIVHPQDNKALFVNRPYLSKRKIVPFGYTNTLYT